MVSPLLGFPLGVMLGALLKFSRRLLSYQGLLQEDHLGPTNWDPLLVRDQVQVLRFHQFCHSHHHCPACYPDLILRYRPHGGRQKNHYFCKSVQKTAPRIRQTNPVYCIRRGEYFIAPLEVCSVPQENTTDCLILHVISNLTTNLGFNIVAESEIAVLVICKIVANDNVVWGINTVKFIA